MGSKYTAKEYSIDLFCDYYPFKQNQDELRKRNINFKMLQAMAVHYPSQLDICDYSITKRRMQACHELLSTVWLDDNGVCLRSDFPFPVRKKKSSSFLKRLPFFQISKRKSFVQPFISPFATKCLCDDKTNLEISLSPRYVAYYEVTLLQCDDTMQEPISNEANIRSIFLSECVAIGLSLSQFNTYHMLGWDKFSYSYHSDYGRMYFCGETSSTCGPTFTTGDTVGCGIDYIKKAIFFTLNGNFLGYAWKDVNLNKEWYPTVQVDAKIPLEINFGNVPFLYDLSFLLDDYSSLINSNVHISSIYNTSFT